MKKNVKVWARILITVVILVALLLKVGIKEIIVQLKSINPWFLIPLVIFNILTIVFTAVGIFLFVRKLKRGITFKNVFKHYLTVWSLNLFIPGRLGDASMIFLLKKEGIRMGKTTAVMLLDNVITIMVIGLFSLIGVYTFYGLRGSLVAVFLLVVLAVVVRFVLQKRQRTFIRRLVLRDKARYFTGFSKSMHQLVKKNKAVVVANVFITVMKTLCAYVSYYVGFRVVSFEVGYLDVLKVMPISRLVSFVPITINGAGIKEGLAVYLFGLLGVAGSIVLAAILVMTVVTYLTGVAIMVTTAIAEKK